MDPRRRRSRAAALQAAGELLVSSGVSAVTFEGVSERSGVARTTLYRHWPTRAALIKDSFWRLTLPPEEPPSEGTLSARLAGPLTRVSDLFVGRSVFAALSEAVLRDPGLESFRAEFVAVQLGELRGVLHEALRAQQPRSQVDLDGLLCLAIGSLVVRGELLGKQIAEADVLQVAGLIEELVTGPSAGGPSGP